jgi:succinate dehydrogenase / fumarate reductase cytochrome b subunit
MWLCDSSIGRKVVMSVTGIALILFLTFHASMNVVALFSGRAYNMICEFLGANWYAVVATIALAALAVLHIVYAFVLYAQNKKARGNNSYAVTSKPEKVEWASQNMLVLGIIVLLGLLLHLFNFWYNMMFAELAGFEGNFAPSDGFAYIVETFSCPVYTVLYLIWIVAIWFHLSHGFWSALHTFGWNGKVWMCRWKVIGTVYVTIIMLMFAVVALAFAFGIAPSLQEACCPGCPGAPELPGCPGGPVGGPCF